MADDRIRLPSDSTVASQKVHRGTELPETQLPKSTVKPVTNPTPLLTIVLQSTPLIEGRKQSLFELLVQNTPKSEPPIRLVSDSDIKPGTSLLLALDKDGEYQAIEKPTPDQLRQLVKLELEFWRTHLMPQANLKSEISLPAINQLKQLATEMPTFEPLIKALLQQPTKVNADQVRQWFQQFQTISTASTATRSAPADAKPGQSTTARTTAELPISAVNQANPADKAMQTPPKPILLPDLRLKTMVGFNNRPITVPELKAALSIPVTVRQSIEQSISVQPTNKPLQFSGQIFRFIPSSETRYPAMPPESHQLLLSVRPAQSNPSVSQTMMAATTATTGIVMPSHSSATLPKAVMVTIHADSFNAMTPDSPKAASNNQADNTNKILSPLPWPERPNQPIEQIIGRSVSRATLPVEFRLNAWIAELDSVIASNPATLKSYIQQQAETMLHKTQVPPMIKPSGVEQSPVKHTKATDDMDATLLLLRNALETSLARLQHSAVQTALQQWSSPDQPIQHIHLPLIWLGLTHWADIEWWQEKKHSDKQKDSKKDSGQAFRMRIFLTLKPLSEFCAELHHNSDTTGLTFWSEDQATLSHLNNLLPTLEQWTQGLGKHQIQTKHGLPKRKISLAEEASTQHLVDIRT
ncbi:MAG: hypothetical protein P8X74_22090 [Reinekea sp.]